MAQAQAKEEPYQEGGRWFHQRPTGKEVAEWFIDNVPMDEGMDAKRYAGGVILIPDKDKTQWTAYITASMRIRYFQDYAQRHGLLAHAEPVPVKKIRAEGLTNEHLPPGYFRFPVKKPDGKPADYVGFSVQMRLYAPDVRTGGLGRPVMLPMHGTKAVPLVDKWGNYNDAFEKAQTLAQARAIGNCGFLVLPSGVATADDMQLGAVDIPAVEPQLPVDSSPTDPRERLEQLRQELESDHPQLADELDAWAKGKGIDINAVPEAHVRAVVRQIERKLAEAQR